MKNYLEYDLTRRKVQIVLCLAQFVPMTLTTVFMLLLAATPTPSSQNFAVAADVFGIVWGACYLAQLIFACATHKKIHQRNKFDLAFLLTSILFAPVGAAIFGIAVLCM